jgi:hypothetical protein
MQLIINIKMVFVAIEKSNGKLIEAKNVTYADSVKRNYKLRV